MTDLEPVVDDPAGGGHLFAISEAAEACGVSRDVIKRRNSAGRFPGAHQDEQGTWRIPLRDLLADGLVPHAPTPSTEAAQGAAQPPGRTAELEQEVAMLRALLAERERLVEAQARSVEALELAIRALNPGPAVPASATATPTVVPSGSSGGAFAPPERRWWQRRTRA